MNHGVKEDTEGQAGDMSIAYIKCSVVLELKIAKDKHTWILDILAAERHNGVMVKMQKGDVTVLLSQNEKHCVDQVGILRQIVEIEHVKFLADLFSRVGQVGVDKVENLTATVQPDKESIVEVSVYGYHGEVVDDHRPLEVERFPTRHELWTPFVGEQKVDSDEQWNLVKLAERPVQTTAGFELIEQ